MYVPPVFQMVLAFSAAALLSLFSHPVNAQVCRSEVPVTLEANGMAVISLEDVQASESPGANLEVSPDSVSCVDIGSIEYRVTDVDTSSFCFGQLNVTDELAPTAVCLPDVDVFLDEEGLGSLAPEDIDGGSIDNCTSAPTFSLDRSEFTCDDVGPQEVRMDVIDDFGNQNFCQVSVNVIESAACHGGDCVKNPNGSGYWFKQCLTVDYDEGGLGRGLFRHLKHKKVAEENIPPDLIVAVGERLDDLLGQSGLNACQDGLKVDWKFDSCDRALRQFTTLLFNIESGRLTEFCPVCLGKPAISATTIGELVDEIAGFIQAGECSKALKIAYKVNRGRGLDCD